MPTSENENYIRVTLLLLEACVFILKEVLQRELNKNNTGLDTELKKYEKKLKHELHFRQFEKLFPSYSKRTSAKEIPFPGTSNIDEWDIQTLYTVILVLFQSDLDVEEKLAIQAIKVHRNEVHSHSSSPTLDIDDFNDKYDQLEKAIKDLASRFDVSTQKKCDDFLRNFRYGPLDLNSSLDQLRKLADSEKIIEAIKNSTETISLKLDDIKSCTEETASNSEARICERLKQGNDDLRKGLIADIRQELQSGRCEKIRQVLRSKLIFRGDDDQVVICADNIVHRVINKAIERTGGSEDTQEIIDAANDILNEIEKGDGLKVKKAEEGCVILYIHCEDLRSLLKFLLLVENSIFLQRLNALASAVGSYIGYSKELKVTYSIPKECLHNLLNELRKKQVPVYQKSITLPVQCNSAAGLEHMLDLFENGGATSSLNKLSTALTKHLGSRVSVEASLDLNEIKSCLTKGDTSKDTLQCSESHPCVSFSQDTSSAARSGMFHCPEYFWNVSQRLSEVLDDIGVDERFVLRRRRVLLMGTLQSTDKSLRNLNDYSHSHGPKARNLVSTTEEGDDDLDAITGLAMWEHGRNDLLLFKHPALSPAYCLLLNRSEVSLPESCSLNFVYMADKYKRKQIKNTELHCSALSVKRTGVSSRGQVYLGHYSLLAKGEIGIERLTIPPASYMNQYEVQNQFFVVPVGRDESENELLEWRINTSIAERYLMFNLDITQLRCYILLKMIVKSFIDTCPGRSISSFMCKSVLFHCIAQHKYKPWKECDLLTHLISCLSFLYQSILFESLPPYLQPEYNLLLAEPFQAQSKRHILARMANEMTSEGRSLLGIEVDDVGQRLWLKMTKPLLRELGVLRFQYIAHPHPEISVYHKKRGFCCCSL